MPNTPEAPETTFTVLHCPDRIVVSGTSIDFGHEDAMRSYCKARGIGELHVAEWARPLTDRLYAMADAYGRMIPGGIVDCNTFKGRKDEHIKKLRKQAKRRRQRCIGGFKSMESCRTFYRSRAKKATIKGSPFYLRQNKCLHFYYYFEDAVLGLVNLRIQTYAPFSIQFIINGHDILSLMLQREGIRHTRNDNCLTYISNHQRAQELAHTITGPFLHEHLQRIIADELPLHDIMPHGYRLCVRQVEYSTDIYLGSRKHNGEKFTQLVQQLSMQRPDEFMSYVTQSARTPKDPRFSARKNHLGTCAKFFNGPLSIKVYHKEPHIIRVETVSYNLTKIRAVRASITRSGDIVVKRNQLTRSLKDIQVFWNFARLANNRMLKRIDDLWRRCYPVQHLHRLANRTTLNTSTYRGINPYDQRDGNILSIIASPAWDLTGFKRSHLLEAIPGLTKHQATYALKRFRAHGLIKKEAKSHRYFPTRVGRTAQIATIAIRNLVLLPLLNAS